MLARLENKDREVWQDNSRLLEDVTHVVGGVGLGLLVYSVFARRAVLVGSALLGLSVLLHLYAAVTPR